MNFGDGDVWNNKTHPFPVPREMDELWRLRWRWRMKEREERRVLERRVMMMGIVTKEGGG
jgi:hypothetical protein